MASLPQLQTTEYRNAQRESHGHEAAMDAFGLACKKPQQESRTLAWAELANAYRLGARACVIRRTPETFPFRS